MRDKLAESLYVIVQRELKANGSWYDTRKYRDIPVEDKKKYQRRAIHILSLRGPHNGRPTRLAVVYEDGELPENPYPEDVFPTTFDEVRWWLDNDSKKITAVSGSYGRFYHDMITKRIIREGFVQEVKHE